MVLAANLTLCSMRVYRNHRAALLPCRTEQRRSDIKRVIRRSLLTPCFEEVRSCLIDFRDLLVRLGSSPSSILLSLFTPFHTLHHCQRSRPFKRSTPASRTGPALSV